MFPPTLDIELSARREDALQFLLGRTNYERWRTMPYDATRMGLERMRQLLEELGGPQQNLPVVHVAGTKGKGSTSAMLAATLSAAGYRTGLFTSPHIDRIEQRISIDGRPCEAEEFVALAELVRPAVAALDRRDAQDSSGPTFFEIITAMAFLHFSRRQAQVAVLEVGLGGRLDATNVCQPAVAVITSISFDHTQQLGNTLAAIAGEKAGIIKPGVPVISGVVEPEARDVIRRVCRERGCRLLERGADFAFDYRPPRHLERKAAAGRVIYRPTGRHAEEFDVALPGRHQGANAAAALAAIGVMRETGWNVPAAAAQQGLAGLSWPARVQVVARRPAVVLDAAHNVASIRALVETLDESFSVGRRLLVFATTHDKDVRGMLQCLLGRFDEIYFTRYSNNSRSVPPTELQQAAEELNGRRWPIFDEPAEAWHAAQASATADDLVCITGSFFLAAEMGPIVRNEPAGDASSRNQSAARIAKPETGLLPHTPPF